MSNEVHRRALRATAKVALSLTAVGCSGSVELVAAKPVDGAGGAQASVTAGGGAKSVAGTGGSIGTGMGGAPVADACQATPIDQPIALNEGRFACCKSFLANQPNAAWNESSVVGPIHSCCNEIVGQIDLQPALAKSVAPKLIAKMFPDHADPSCCDVLGNPCGAACGCTVWGPPVPRAAVALRLLDELDLEAEVA